MAQRPSEADGSNAVTAEHVARADDRGADRGPALGGAGVSVYRQRPVCRAGRGRRAGAQHRQRRAATGRRPSANLVRQYLLERLFERADLDTLDARCNALLVGHLPPGLVERPLRLALDLTLLPYSGTEGLEPDQLRRGAAKAGTRRFHWYATASVRHAGRRVTLALTFVRADEALLAGLVDLLDCVRRLGMRIRRLFRDREFASVALLRHLAAQPFTSVVALPRRGERRKALLVGCASDRTSYTMRRPEDGERTCPLYVACRYAAGRRSRHGIAPLPFAGVGRPGCGLSVRQVADEYRARFGIERGDRQMPAVRARTTSRDPALRLLLVTIALLLVNLWGWLKAHLVTRPPRSARAAARAWRESAFRLDRFGDLLWEAIRARAQVHTALHYPFRFATPLKL